MNIGDALAAYRNATQTGGGNAPQVETVSFADMIKGLGQNLNESLRQGEQTMSAAVLGRASITDVVTAVSSAEATLQTAVAIRDRIMTAYQEILKTQV